MAPEAMKHPLDECPDLETLAQYLDGRLTTRARERVADHLTTCETCYFVFSEAARTHVVGKPRKVPLELLREWISKRTVQWAAATAAVAAAASIWLMVGTGWLGRSLPSTSPELQALVAAVGPDRTIEPRLTGGFMYGPVRGAVRAGEPSVATAPPDVRIAAARIEKEVGAHRTPDTLRSLGIAYLVTGDTTRAVPVLEEAADASSSDARILSDLSAAYLVRATHNNQPQDFARALSSAERAATFDPHVAEAWFNRALALEALSLRDQARDAWQKFLTVDSTSGWADEARSHLKALTDSSSLRTIDEERLEVDTAVRAQNPAVVADFVRNSPHGG
jgi:tetratricopeptide (TPR) repeat protein